MSNIDPNEPPAPAPPAGPTINPPWRLDPLQNPINIQWDISYYLLVWIKTNGFGHTRDGCVTQNVEPLPLNQNFDQEPFNPKVTLSQDASQAGAKEVFKRVDQIIHVDTLLQSTRSDGGYSCTETVNGSFLWPTIGICNPKCFWAAQGGPPENQLCGSEWSCYAWLSCATSHPCCEAAFMTPPATGTCGGGFGGAYAIPDDCPLKIGTLYTCIDVLVAPVMDGISTLKQTSAIYEGVWLIKVPSLTKTTKPMITVTVGGYSCGITVLLYPSTGIKVDSGNTTSTWDAQPPTGRVYVPLNWSSDDNKPPKGPDGKDWPGYPIVGCPAKDVKNALVYWGGVSPDKAIGSRDYKIVITKEKHLTSGVPKPADPPTLYDMSVKDVIAQMYMDDSSAGKPQDHWFGGRYCDVPYGQPFAPILDNDLNRGPNVLIDKDIAVT